MSAPLRLCGLCGKPVGDHAATVLGGITRRECEAVDPGTYGIFVRDVLAWPLGGGQWEVRTA